MYIYVVIHNKVSGRSIVFMYKHIAVYIVRIYIQIYVEYIELIGFLPEQAVSRGPGSFSRR